MVAVIVHNDHAVLLAFDLKSAIDSAIVRKRSGYLLEVDIEIQPDCRGRKRVVYVVYAGNIQSDLSKFLPSRLDDEPRAELLGRTEIRSRYIRLRRHTVCDESALYMRNDRLHVVIVETEHYASIERHFVDEADEVITDLADVFVVVHVLAIDIRHDGNGRRKF